MGNTSDISIEVHLDPEEMKTVLQNLGIEINSYGVAAANFPDHVNEKIAKIPFFCHPTYEERVAISIAVSEFKNKRPTESHEITILNHFLGIKINRDLISRMKGIYLNEQR